MKSSTADRRKRAATARPVEALENRCLLTASVVSAIPAQNLITASGGMSQLTLSGFLNDPSLTGGTVIEMQTPLGNIPFQLTDAQTPLTVANFVKYINNGEYEPTIIQRSLPGFVLQGGGTKPDGSNNTPVSTLVSEAHFSNTTGTIAMALSGNPQTGQTDPNSGTNQWFINLGNNTGLDSSSNGPFTVFGAVIDGGMSVVNAIAALPTINGAAENSNWHIPNNGGDLPVINYSGPNPLVAGSPISPSNLVTDTVVAIPAGQTVTYSAVSANPSVVTASISNGVLTLAPAAGVTSGTTTVTATVTDLSGTTASTTFTVGINLASTTTSIVTSNPATVVGSPVTLTATVTSSIPGTTPTGFVTFLNGNTPVAAAVQLSGNTAVLTTALPAGTLSLTAFYNGDASDSTSTSQPVTENVITPTVTGSLIGTTTTNTIATTPLKLKEKVIFAADNGAAKGTATATVDLSPDSSAAHDVFSLALAHLRLNLKNGKSKSLNLRVARTIPASVAAGTYHVLLTTTDTAGNVITTDSGQTVTVAAPVVDLTGSFVTPVSVTSGKKTRISVFITNSSDANVAAVGLLQYDLDASPDGLLSDASILLNPHRHINLKPGKSIKIVIVATLNDLTPILVNLDPGHVNFPNDIDPANNVFSTTPVST